MAVTVWVDDWQMQCCGEGFASGGVVSWDLVRVDPEDYADVVGRRRAAVIDFREEHHGQQPDCAAVSLEVLTVVEVHCRYEAPPGTTALPVPGTAVLVPAEEADGWAEVRPGLRFAGYLVTARLA
ncbi:DUF6578 domain-containing protein [Streptomyces globisporus]|uniref:DUF6578 domain-containing protein n=1 Tax=Streptomyces globisporus TaxID=1908 RepID=UPI0004C64006|nr:DUF6578 domain-containing protein [Streptomyces globisporus]